MMATLNPRATPPATLLARLTTSMHAQRAEAPASASLQLANALRVLGHTPPGDVAADLLAAGQAAAAAAAAQWAGAEECRGQLEGLLAQGRGGQGGGLKGARRAQAEQQLAACRAWLAGAEALTPEGVQVRAGREGGFGGAGGGKCLTMTTQPDCQCKLPMESDSSHA